MLLDHISETIAECEVVEFEERSVLHIKIGEVLLVGEIHIINRCSDVTQVWTFRTIEVVLYTPVGSNIVIHIVPNLSMTGSGQGPLFVLQRCENAISSIRVGALVMIPVGIRDLPVMVAVNIQTFDWYAIGIINLLVNIE